MKKLLLAIAISLFATSANAATCFWVGGVGTWSTANTASWASTTGGTTGTCAATGGIPKQAADTATFDGASGGGVVTVDSTINGVTLTAIVMDAFTGTLDFSVNNPSLTLTASGGAAFSCNGAATHTLNLGSGTFTISGASGTLWLFTTTTNLTLNAGTSTLLFNGAPTQGGSLRSISLGSTAKAYSTITVSNTGSSGVYADIIATGAITVANFNLTAPVGIRWNITSSFTITNAFTWAGTAFNSAIELFASAGTTPTITAASGSTITWATIAGMTFAGTAVNATNSFDLKGNTMNGGSITGPSGGAATGHIIGG